MKKLKLAICDKDADYVERFMSYLESQGEIPFELMGFTDIRRMERMYEEKGPIQLVVISEELYERELEKTASHTLVLTEGRGKTVVKAWQTDKYQSAREIYKTILELCIEEAEVQIAQTEESPARVLGFYSPVKRAMQTAFALALGRSLATRYRVLYVSFEPYAGWRGFLQREGGKDLFDLLYYLKEPEEKFVYRLKQVEQKMGELDYIPPVLAGQNLVYITVREWLSFLKRLKDMGKYDFILLDLSDCLQGLFEILRMCEKVFTVTMPQGTAIGKMEQYEYLLRMYECDDVIGKSVKKQVPELKAIPDDGQWWTVDGWRQFIRKVETEDLRV